MGRRPNNGSDYLEYINKSGSIRELSIRVSKDANVDASEVILKLPRVLDKLTEKQAKVIRKYYLCFFLVIVTMCFFLTLVTDLSFFFLFFFLFLLVVFFNSFKSTISGGVLPFL